MTQDADADFLSVADTTFGFPSPLSFNGDDAIVLMTPSGIMVDVIGRIGEDPGSYWGSTVQTRNQTLVRLGSIQRGDSDGNDAFDPATEWESFPQNTYQTLAGTTVIVMQTMLQYGQEEQVLQTGLTMQTGHQVVRLRHLLHVLLFHRTHQVVRSSRRTLAER